MFKIIAAIGKNRELGLKNALVFHIKEDMRFFRESTTGHAVLMGAKTFQSLPGALKNRTNYVLTHNPDNLPENVVPVTNLKKFIHDNLDTEEEVFVIGGAKVYDEMLPYCQTLYLTEVEAEHEADVFFPNFDKTMYNKTIIKRGNENGLNYTFNKYEKI